MAEGPGAGVEQGWAGAGAGAGIEGLDPETALQVCAALSDHDTVGGGQGVLEDPWDPLDHQPCHDSDGAHGEVRPSIRPRRRRRTVTQTTR